jgi:hypothetical protein
MSSCELVSGRTYKHAAPHAQCQDGAMMVWLRGMVCGRPGRRMDKCQPDDAARAQEH